MENNVRLATAERIKETREYLGLTQQQVAKALSLHRSAISDIETGKRKVSVDELKMFAKLFKHPVSHFIGGESEIAEDAITLARTAENLSDNDKKELLRFAKFLEYRSKNE